MKLLSCLLVRLTLAAADITTRSQSFYLAILSDNATYHGKAVTTYHQGALITSLAVSNQIVNLSETPPPFALNFVSEKAGSLEFLSLTPPTTTNPNVTSTYFPMVLQYYPYTNTAMGFFQPPNPSQGLNAQNFVFDDNDFLVMSAPPMDDTLAPNWQPQPSSANATVNRWFVCDTWAPAPYQATSVVWGLGAEKPQNPTCVKVDLLKITA